MGSNVTVSYVATHVRITRSFETRDHSITLAACAQDLEMDVIIQGLKSHLPSTSSDRIMSTGDGGFYPRCRPSAAGASTGQQVGDTPSVKEGITGQQVGDIPSVKEGILDSGAEEECASARTASPSLRASSGASNLSLLEQNASFLGLQASLVGLVVSTGVCSVDCAT